MANDENTGVGSPPTITLPVDVNKKGIKTLTIYLDQFEQVETGTVDKNGKLVHYVKYRILK